MEKLVSLLNYYTEQYDKGTPEISDEQWDSLYFKLREMEKETGVILDNSPTRTIHYEVVNSLKKVTHNHDMLSLDKTKDLNDIENYFGNREYFAMLKMDGLTCSLRYVDGILESAETRGDGKIGEDILHNARVVESIPNVINYQGELVIDGEIICTYDDFEKFSEEYKNPRNFAAGSIRLLDSRECENRNLTFIAWEVIKGFEECKLLSEKFEKIAELGFTVVPYCKVEALEKVTDALTAKNTSYPIDGLVFKFNDCEYGRSLGATSHHAKNALAYKFYDETYESKLLNIEWTMGRTGVLTPVAIFDSIEIDGSVVERANLHNVSVMKSTLSGGFGWRGQRVSVYKANAIIPQISEAEADDDRTKEYFSYPHVCPICGAATEIITQDSGTEILVCTNDACEGKLVNKLDHFCGKKGLDIKGLSKATLDKLISWGWVSNYKDIFNLAQHRRNWIIQPGFGEKSVDRILSAVNEARNTTLDKFLSAIGIPMIGKTVGKELAKKIKTYAEFREMVNNKFNFSQYDGFAENKTAAILSFNYEEADAIAEILNISSFEEEKAENTCEGLKIVITGRLNIFKNRPELKQAIEAHDGTVVESITKNTSFLINNDLESASSKNQTAKKLNIPIISEKDFFEKFLKN